MRRSLAVAGGLCLAVVFSQFPEYAQQYTQRLGGAVDELRAITVDFDKAASDAGMTRQQALVHYSQSTDQFLAGRGLSMSQTFVRYAELSATLAEVKGADAWERFRHLRDYLDSEIGARTLDDFKPAVPVTAEGLFYAVAGFVLGYIAMSIVFVLLLVPFRWRRRPRRWRITEV